MVAKPSKSVSRDPHNGTLPVCLGALALCAALCLAGVPMLESIQQKTENLFL